MTAIWCSTGCRYIFQETDELFQGLPDMFDIADDILVAGFDNIGKDHDATHDKILRICMQAGQLKA